MDTWVIGLILLYVLVFAVIAGYILPSLLYIMIHGSPAVVPELRWEPLIFEDPLGCLLYTTPSPRDRTRSRMPSSA